MKALLKSIFLLVDTNEYFYATIRYNMTICSIIWHVFD